MNLDPKEFWFLAKEIDSVTNKPKNKKMHSASYGIEEHPIDGPGAHGGGRICVCENCGAALWTHSKTKQFCSPICRSEFYSSSRTPRDSTLIRSRGSVTKKCCFCNKEFTLPIYRLKLGHGIYCSPTCANHARGFKPLWYKCNTCGTEFRSITDWGSRFCCIQCAENKPITDEAGEYYESIPRLLYPEDQFDHVVNLILEKFMKRGQKNGKDPHSIIVSPTLRAKAIAGRMNEKVPNYYLNKRERDVLRLMELLDDEEDYHAKRV